jgi:hypothetical protein
MPRALQKRRQRFNELEIMDKRDSPTSKAFMDTSRFDRRVELTDYEKKAINNITINICDWRMLDKMKPQLQRFYDPLEEARLRIFENSSQPCAQGYPLLNFILTIGEKGRSFWGWTRDDWQDLFHKDGRSGFQIPLAIAYLLCGIESLPRSYTRRPDDARIGRVKKRITVKYRSNHL